MIEQRLDVILIPALNGFIGVEVIVTADIFPCQLCPLDILSHAAECFPVICKGNQQSDTFLLCLVQCIVQLLQAVLAFVDDRSAQIGIEILIVHAFLFAGAVYAVGEYGVTFIRNLIRFHTGI